MTKVDALIKEAIRIQTEAIDHERETEEEFATNIANYLAGAQLSKALIECREAIGWVNYYVDGFKNLADGIVKLMDTDLQDNIAADIRALTARVSDAETITTPTEARALDEARRHLIAVSIVIEDGELSYRGNHTAPHRCNWCGKVGVPMRHILHMSDSIITMGVICTDCLDWKRDENDNIVVIRLNAKLDIAEPETPIYETLAPNDCLIISKDGDSLLVACNNGGELVVKRVHFGSKIDDAGRWDVEDWYRD